MPGKGLLVTVVGVTVMLATPAHAGATPAPGSPDRSFGSQGSVTEGTSNSYAGAVYRQPNGQIVFPTELNGQATLIRMNGNGTLDQSFGNSGVDQVAVNRLGPSSSDTSEYQTTRVAFGYSGFTAVTEASDGTYYASGYSDASENQGAEEYNGFIAHLLSNGLLDPRFGTDGVVTYSETDLPGSGGPYYCTNMATSISALPNDAGVVVALSNCNGYYGLAPVEIYDTFGNVNPTFAAAVNQHIPVFYPTSALAFGRDVLVNVCPGYPAGSDAVAALLPNGTLDTAWGVNGCSPELTDPSGGSDQLSLPTVALGPGNTILIVDNSGGSTSDSWMARLTAAGQIDPTFGTGTPTMAATPLDGTGDPWVQSVSVSPASGAVLLAAQPSYDPTTYAMNPGEVASVRPDGTTDTSFGTNGIVTLPASFETTGLEVQPNYRVVVSGTAGGTGCRFPYLPDPPDANPPFSAVTNDCTAGLQGYVDNNL